MTSARHTSAPTSSLPLSTDLRQGDPADTQAPIALRTVLLLSGAAHASDPLLARLSDHELQMLRASLTALSAPGSTSAA